MNINLTDTEVTLLLQFTGQLTIGQLNTQGLETVLSIRKKLEAKPPEEAEPTEDG